MFRSDKNVALKTLLVFVLFGRQISDMEEFEEFRFCNRSIYFYGVSLFTSETNLTEANNREWSTETSGVLRKLNIR